MQETKGLLQKPFMISIVLAVLMLSSSVLTKILIPANKIADQREGIILETIIPQKFGEWHIDQSIIARTYVNSDGERIMFSVAYGGDQSDNLAVHKPEVCYYAQGFEINKIMSGELLTEYGILPIRRLLASKGNRHEPITYWVTIGDKAVMPGIEQKLQQLRYGLTGNVPDGMLVRISSISSDEDKAYYLQNRFILDLLSVMDTFHRTRLIGAFKA